MLGDFVGAQAVANDVPLLTQRLRLLAVLVDAAADCPGAATQPLKDEIRELLSQVDVDTLPTDEAIDIAIDLYPVDPRAAVNLLKNTITDDVDDDSFEIALARITVAALQSEHTIESSASPSGDSPKSTEMLVDERIRTFIDAARISVNARSGVEVLSLTADVVAPAERLFILRTWITQHPDDHDVLSVVETTLNEGIAANQFSPTATFYREVLAPLPGVIDTDTRTRLVALVDAQKPVIQAKGPTVDYVRTQLILAFSNYMDQDPRQTVERLEELYLECLDEIPDLEIRTVCLAWCIAELEHYDPLRKLDTFSDFRELVDRDFDGALASVFDHGADQFVILEKALEPLAVHLPTRATAIVSKFNTATRRDQGRFHLVRVMCDGAAPNLDYALLFQIIDGIGAGPILDRAISIAGTSVANHIRDGSEFAGEVDRLVSRLPNCSPRLHGPNVWDDLQLH